MLKTVFIWMLLCLCARANTVDFLVHSWQVEDGLPGNTVTCIEQTRDGWLWIGTHNGLARFDGVDFYPVGAQTTSEIRSNRITALLEDREGALWAGTDGGGVFRLFNGHVTVLTRQEGLPEDRVTGLHLDAEKRMMIQTPSGNCVWQNGELSACKMDFRTPVAETFDPRVYHIRFPAVCTFRDREGLLWVGTDGGGLYRIRRRRFVVGGSDQKFVAIADNQLGSLLMRQPDGGILYQNPPFGLEPWPDAAALPTDAGPGPLLRTTDGAVWAGTARRGLWCFKDGTARQYGKGEGMTESQMLSLFEDREKRIWIGTAEAGLYCLEEGRVRHFGAEDGLPARNLIALAQDVDGDLWIGSDGEGLYRYADGGFSQIDRRESRGSDFVTALLGDSSGSLWIGSRGGGLTRMKDGVFHTMGSRQGLNSDDVSQLMEGRLGFIWVGTSRGLFRFRPEAFQAYAAGETSLVDGASYGRSEGFKSLEFTGYFQPAVCEKRNGALFFTTLRGFVGTMNGMADVEALDGLPPEVHIDRVLADETILFNSLHRSELHGSLTVNPGVRRIVIRYTGINFSSPEEIFFRHRLSGVDDRWVDAGKNRAMAYVGLKPGHYRFEVIAASSDGVWNREGASLELKVLPFFWQTAVFRWGAGLLIVLLVGGTVRAVVMRRLRFRMDEQRRREALEAERVRIARDIHDDAGARLTRISMLIALMKRDHRDEHKLSAHLDQVAVATHDVTESLDEVVWAVDPGNDTLEHLAAYVGRFAEEFLSEADIRCRLSIPPELPERSLSSAMRHSIFLMVKEALNNIVKHSGASTVRFSLRMDSVLTIEIEDDGRGFDEASIVKGCGLNNMQSRAEGLGGTCRVESRPEGGTRIIVSVPIEEEKQ